MARVNHKRVKQLLNEKRSRITDRQFFTSRILAGHFEDMAMAQTRRYKYNRRIHVAISWSPKSGEVACTNNLSVLINAGHRLVTQNRGRENRYEIVCGLFAHELGHCLYTDFLAGQTYSNYLSREKWYPEPPVYKLPKDTVSERALWEYVRLEPRNNEMLRYVAHHISNVIEDAYIENRILAQFRGTLGNCLEALREQQYESIPTVTELIEKEDDGNCHIQLASEQRHAVTTALTSQLSVITGGPGTGKTLIQRFLLDIYRRKNRGAKIICCAPTGRAARRMEQSTGFPATTIHKALGLLAGEDGDYCEPEMLDADLIVVDEVSMMDIYLANHLFRSVPHGSQLVLIGDADQLPSVGPGAVLSEIIACGAVPVVRLDRIFRQSYGSRIAANAKLIRHGNLSLEYGEDFQFYDSCDMSASAQQIETLYLQETARYGVDNVALLTPYRQKTETGVNALNERLREKLNPQDGKKPEVAYRKRIYRLGDKVMQIKNCEDISNGDIGYITSVTRDDTDSVLTVDFGDGRIAEYDGSDLEMLDLAYASTIHKSQGSEYKSVIINLQCAHAVMLVRPLVYTAITRAKERVLIVGERRALCIAIKRTDTEQRGTMLSARIKELISNVKGDHYNGNLAQ